MFSTRMRNLATSARAPAGPAIAPDAFDWEGCCAVRECAKMAALNRLNRAAHRRCLPRLARRPAEIDLRRSAMVETIIGHPGAGPRIGTDWVALLRRNPISSDKPEGGLI